MEKIYNKLVRDNIPEIIKKDNCIPYIRVLSDEEYKVELEKKLYEEYQEVLGAKESSDRIEELADMLELIISLARLENKSIDDVLEVAKKKSAIRGGFDKKIFLEKVVSNDSQ